jgi:hypothetical protein
MENSLISFFQNFLLLKCVLKNFHIHCPYKTPVTNSDTQTTVLHESLYLF